MSDKEGDLEEICIGHLLDYFGNKDKPYDLKIGDLKILKQLYGWPGPHCANCTDDEFNRNCPFYKPVKIHKYNVLPADEPKKD